LPFGGFVDAQEVTKIYRKPSSSFIENKGQWERELLYKADVADGRLRLYNESILVSLLNSDDRRAFNALIHDESEWAQKALENHVTRGHNYRIKFVNSNPAVQISGEEKQETYHNYFIGNDPDKWASNVSLFSQVKYTNLWEGIDLVLKESGGYLKYDIIVHPGADISQIQLEYIGQDGMALVNDELIIRTSVREVKESKPFVYQEESGELKEVEAGYKLEGNRMFFTLPEGYDPSQKLIIDPQVEIIFSTYSGAGSENWGHTATYDKGSTNPFARNLYGGGRIIGGSLPNVTGSFDATHNGNWDFQISKYNVNSNPWSTFIGGSSDDMPHSMISDDFGNLIIFGSTTSNNFPTGNQTNEDPYDETYNGDVDIVIFKLSSNGQTMMASTYFGGSGTDGRHNGSLYYNYGDDFRGEVMVNQLGKIMIASVTTSSNIAPGYSGGADALVAKFSSDLANLEFATLIGGPQDDQAASVKINDNDQLVVCGGTRSSTLPVTGGVVDGSYNGDVDGFVAVLNPVGFVQALTYIGTPFYDQARFIEIGTDDYVYVLGNTQGSWGGPIPATAYMDFTGSQFVIALNMELTEYKVRTKFGSGSTSGLNNLSLTAFLVDTCRNIYISGWGGGLAGGTTINGLPLSSEEDQGEGLGAFDVNNNGGNFYFAVFAPEMEKLFFGSYFGSSGSIRPHVDGGTSRFDENGYIYQGICACGSNLNEPPIVNPAHPNNNAGCNLATVKVWFDVGRAVAEGGAEPTDIQCYEEGEPYTVDFYPVETNGVEFIWDFGDSSEVSTEETPTHTYQDTGTYMVYFTAIDSSLCIPTAVDSFPLTIKEIPVSEGNLVTGRCDSLVVNAETLFESWPDFVSLEWNMGDGNTYADTNSVTHYYDDPGTYIVSLNVSDETCGYDTTYTQEVFLPDSFANDFNILDSLFQPLQEEEICGTTLINFENEGSGLEFIWDFGDGSVTSTEFEPAHNYDFGQYQVQLISIDSTKCNLTDTTYKTLRIYPINELFADFVYDGNCDQPEVEFINTGTPGLPEDLGGYTWYFGDGSTGIGDTSYHNYASSGTYTISLVVDDTTACTIRDSIAYEATIRTSLDVQADFFHLEEEDCDYEERFFFTGNDPEGSEVLWNMGDGTEYTYGSDVIQFDHVYDTSGYYLVTLVVRDPECLVTDSTFEEIYIEPQIIASFLSGEGGCSPYSPDLFNTSTPGEQTTYSWDFGNSQVSNEINPSVTYSVTEAQTFEVWLLLVDPLSCNKRDSISTTVSVSPVIDLELEEYYKLCDDSSIVIDAGEFEADYFWSTGNTQQTQLIDEQGNYYVVVTNEFCQDSAGFFVEVFLHPSEDFSTTVCPEPPLVLSPSATIGDFGIVWNTGETTQTIEVTETGKYYNYYLDENQCARHDTMRVTVIDDSDRIFAPNSFTPNGDGLNETWKVFGGSENDYQLQLFDRWGNLVWETTDIDETWDGVIDGRLGEPGVYVYKVFFYSECYQRTIDTHGTVLLMR
jgi:gliding motility-associated-like protein